MTTSSDRSEVTNEFEDAERAGPTPRPVPTWLRRPTWIELIATIVWFSFAVREFSDVVADFFNLSIVILSGVTLALIWSARLLFVSAIWGPGRSRPLRAWEWITWGITPAAGLMGLIMAAGGIDLKLRVALCEPSLTAYASSLQAGTEGDIPRWVGLFHILRVETDPRFIYLTTRESMRLEYGLVLDREGHAQDMPFQHVYRQWYQFRREF